MRYENIDQVKEGLKRAEKSYLKRMCKYDWFDPKNRPFRPAINFKKRSGVFQDSNVYFNPITIHATSYKWWDMVRVINGLVVFNSYRYSISTSKHQYKVERLMDQLGIKIDVRIEAPKGLQNLESAVTLYQNRIDELLAEIASPRSRKKKNIERKHEINRLDSKLAFIKKLMKGGTQ